MRVLLLEAEESIDPKKRSQLIMAAEKLVLDEAIVIPVFYRQGHYAVTNRVDEVFLSDISQIDFSRTRIKPRDIL